MTQVKHTGMTRILKAFGYSWAGLKAAYAEAAFRQELAVLAVAVPLAFVVAGSAVEWVLMVGSLLLVLVVEILNTAIEVTIDRVSGEQHPLSKKAKDLGSAAVFIALLNAGLIWLALVYF